LYVSSEIEFAGVKSDARLILEAGTVLNENEMSIRYAVLTGNATTPVGGGGKKSRQLELNIDSSLSIESLKAALVSNSKLANGSEKKRRLRKTNWAEDPAGLVLNESKTLFMSDISHGDLLLFEEGVVG